MRSGEIEGVKAKGVEGHFRIDLGAWEYIVMPGSTDSVTLFKNREILKT
jgi:hypothetical protein